MAFLDPLVGPSGTGNAWDNRRMFDAAQKQLATSTIRVFTSTTDRDQAITAPKDGQVVYLNTGDTQEGLWTFNGSTWRKLDWNAPWGYLATISGSAVGTNLRAASSSAAVDYVSGSYTHVNNRRVRVTAMADASWTTATNVAWRLRQGSTTVAYADSGGSGSFNGMTSVAVVTTDGTSQSYTFSLLFGAAVTNVLVSVVVPTIVLEDIGPSGAPV